MTDSLHSVWGGRVSRDRVWVYSYSRSLGQPHYSFSFTTHAHLCGSTGLETLLWAVNAADIKSAKGHFHTKDRARYFRARGFLSLWLAGGM